MSTPNDLQALFASIKPRPSPSHDGQPPAFAPPGSRSVDHQSFEVQRGGVAPARSQPPHQQPHYFPQHAYLNPSVSSPLYSPGPANTPPHHDSDIISPNVPTPRGDNQQRAAGADQAASLLNLLKFSQNKPASPQLPGTSEAPSSQPVDHQETGASAAQQSHARTISASDLVASFVSKPAVTPDSSTHAPPPAATVASHGGASETSTNAQAQEMLLRLLNRSQSKPEDGNRAFNGPPGSQPRSPEPQVETGSFVAQSSMHVFGSSENRDLPESEAPQPTPPKGSLFTYSNPFEDLARHTKSKSRGESPAADAGHSKQEFQSVLDAKPRFNAPVKFVPAGHTPEPEEKQSEQKETVSNAVGEIAQQLERQVEDALSRATKEETSRAENISKNTASAVAEETDTSIVKTEAEKQESMVKEPASNESVKETVEPPAEEKAIDGNVADSWESAEDSAEKTEERVIRVFNFPLKPFISIVVKPDTGKLPSFRDDGIMDVARLKKEFDQLDRCLTSATAEYIIYALAKNGGLRIIRQDDGRDKQIFRFARDRLFNVALSHAAPTASGILREQAVLAIGVSGSVYWAPVCRGEDDLFELDSVESDCLIFPPYPSSDENTSGGQLKTRAKPSSRHTEFFGIGRGKNIYIVSPQFAAQSTYGVSGSQRIVDTEKFFKEHALKISTGKAGKDFTFSEDDSVVASLDKTGRLRFWDIREVDQVLAGSPPPEVRTPLATFVTGSPNEKSWPTSVLFIDKLRPFVKAVALRYVLVGLKQNHTLQLWDIGLGKAVQEVSFPHEKESDAICSVSYHPSSGIIVVGHPTRNSVYFLHLSAPKYNLQPMSQATYIKRVAEKDATLPKPDSTACLSGIREVSFASKGQLRSLDILPISKSMGSQRNVEEEAGLFEIYAMYSRGVTCLNIKKEDLGWTPENKIIEPVDGLKEGYIEVNDLQTFPTYTVDEPSINGDSVATTSSAQKPAAKDTGKKATDVTVDGASNVAASRTASPVKPVGKVSADEQAEVTSGADKAKKKKKEKVKDTAKAAAAAPPSNDLNKYFTPAKSTQQSNEEEVSNEARIFAPNGESVNFGVTSEMINQLEKGISEEVLSKIRGDLDVLHTRFDEERRAWDAASSAKTDQVLRLVSRTLSENVEKNLARIINDSIKEHVLPAVINSVSTSVNEQMGDALSKQLGQIFPREMRQVLLEYISRAVKQQEVLRPISDAIGSKVAHQMETEFARSNGNTMAPAITAAIARHSDTVIKDLEQRFQAQKNQFELQRRQDAAKIDQLTNLVQTMNESHTSMIASHATLQNEIALLRQQSVSREQIPVQPPPMQPKQAPTSQRTPEDIELDDIVRLAKEGNLEEASVRWLQSSQQADLFDNFFVRLDPAYLSTLSPIVSLSVGVAVTTSLDTNVQERLGWLDYVLKTVNLADPDIRDVAPQIMDILIQRLNTLYMAIANKNPHDPVLRRIPPLARRAQDLRG